MPSIAETWVTVIPNTAEVASGIRKVFRELDASAREAGQRWGREIQQGLGDAKVNVSADTAKARAEIDAAAKDRHSTVHVDVDKDRLSQIDGAVGGALAKAGEKGAASMGQAVASGVADLGPKLSSQAASSGASIGSSMGGAMSPVLMAAGVTALAGIASAASGLAGLIPAAAAGAGTGIGTLMIGLDGVADAYKSVTKAAQDSGTDQKAQAEAVASASRTLRDAVQSEAQAQQDVANARKDARQQLDDLNLSLRGGQISETDAILAAKKARQDLATGTYQTSLDYEIAQQRVVDADQRVRESHQRVVDLQSKANDANAKGVDNADNVKAANERLVRSQESVTQAQTGLFDAQNKVSSSAKEAAQAMAQLSPNAQAFVNTLVGLKPAFQDFKNSVQDALFANMGPQIQQLAGTYLPILKGALTQMATAMNQAFSGIAKLLQSPQMLSNISTIFNNIVNSFKAFTPAINPLIQAFTQLTTVGSGFLPQLADGAVKAAQGFAQFIDQASKSGQLQQWIQLGINTMNQLWPIIQTVSKAFLDLAPIGTAVLGGLKPIVDALAPSIAPLSKAFASLITAISPVLALTAQLNTVIYTAIAPALTTWFNAMTPVIQQIAGALQPILKSLQPVLAQMATTLAQSMVQGIQTLLPVLIPFVQQCAQLLAAVFPLVPPLIQLALTAMPAFQQAVATILPIMTKWMTKLTDLANFIIPPLAQAVKILADSFTNQFSVIKTVVGDVWDFVKPIFEKMKSYLEYISPALQLLGLIPASASSGGSASGSGYLPKTGAPAVPGSPGSPMAPFVPGQAPPRKVGSDSGLLPATIGVKDQISSQFTQITDIGGWRPPDGYNEHSSGQAIDVMVPNSTTPQGQALGDQISQSALQNPAVDYTLWRQAQHNPDGSVVPMSDRGSPTANHMDHVHIHTKKDAAANTAPQSPIASPGLGQGTAGMSPAAAAAPAAAGAPGGVPSMSQFAGPGAVPGGLTPQSTKEQVAAAIIAEGQRRGFTPDQIKAVLSTGLQESGLSPTASGGGGAWHGIFQQDTSYPGRDDPNKNISAFFDRLGKPQGDAWNQIFALQQGNAWGSPNARGGYMSEIKSKMGEANQLYNSASSGGTPAPAGTPNDPMYMALSPNIPAGQQKGPGSGQSMEQLGQQLGPDALQIFGLDGSVFKDPTSFGIMKLFSGLINGLTGIKTGGGGGGGYPGGSGGGGGGGLGGLLGLIPQGFGNLQVGSPQNAPGQFMPLQPGSGGGSLLDAVQFKPPGGQGSPGPGNAPVDNSITVNMQGNNPDQAFSAAQGANIPRMRQGLNSLP